MRRSPALVLTLSLFASTMLAFSGASAVSLAGVAYTGTETGNLSTVPLAYTDGQTITLYANFDANIGLNDVTFYEETGPGTNDYDPIGTDEANTYGNAYKYDYVVHGEHRIFAQVVEGAHTGEVTEVATITPSAVVPIDPANYPDGGNLSTDPASFTASQNVSVNAYFPDGNFDISLYKETSPGVWDEVAKKASTSSGNAFFTGIQISSAQKFFALTSTDVRTEVDTYTPLSTLTLSVERDCTGNDCTAGTASAYGELVPAATGIPVTLQWLDGSTWKQIGSPVNSDAAGKVRIQFSLSGLSQWSTRTYRLVAGPVNSNQIKFMPGPTQLGPNVLHVDVAKGVYPTSTSAEYTGKATLRQNGVDKATDVALEKFGVRGSSTASYTKKPYKLKFVNAPADIFGMPKDKSWTLLANYLDQSFMRDKVGLELGRRMGNIPWTPDSRYVEMFVNDQYVGAYLMTESVKIDGDRVDINENSGMIMETDGNSVADSSLGFKSTRGNIAFAFKDPDEVGTGSKDVNSTKLNAIKSKINTVESKLYTTSRNQYPNYLDVASTIDFYLVKEFTKDNDADFYRSNYFWWDPVDGDGKLHFGPAWDFDRSAGNVDADTAGHTYVRSPIGWYLRGTGTRSDSGRVNYTTHWFVQLFKTTSPVSFNAAVKARWPVVKAEFEKTWAEDTAAAKAAIGIGASNDRKRWASEPKRYKSHVGPNGETGFAGEVAYLTKWYKDRFNWMNGQLSAG